MNDIRILTGLVVFLTLITVGTPATIFAEMIGNSGSLNAEEAATDPSCDASPVQCPGFQCDFDCGCCAACWTFAADALFLTRSSPESLGLIFADVAGNPGPEVFNASSLDSDIAVGPRLSLVRNLCGCRSVEFNVFGIDSWSAVGSATGPVHATFPGFVQAFTPATTGVGTATFTNTSNLFSAEANVWQEVTDRVTLLAGLRWVELGDELQLQFTPTGGATSTMYRIDANNHLYGGQIGALANLWDDGLWMIDGWIKAGVFYNSADQSTDVFFPAVASAGDRDDATSFVGDVALIAVRPITDQLSLRLGYQLLWVEGVALASDQLNGVNDITVPIAVLDTNSGVFYHGGFVGAQYDW